MRTNLAVHTAELGGAPLAAPPLTSIFLAFLKLGAFAFGGVYTMLSFLEKELVERRRWLTSEELAESVVIGQMTPGPPIVNTGVFIGYRLRGLRGAFAATLGQVLPGFLIVLVVGVVYAQLRSAPLLGGALKGIAAAVVGLLGSVVLKMGRQVVDGARTGIIALACFALLAVAHANPILLIASSGLAGYVLLGARR
jgi:chromate transporter